jgi:hypothetical protein
MAGTFAAGVLETFAAGVLGTFAAGVLGTFTADGLGTFTAGGSGTFTAGGSGTFTAGGSGTFTAIAVFSTVIVFSFPVSVFMDTRGGGIGVIPIIGVIHIPIILTPTIRISRVFKTTTSMVRLRRLCLRTS